MWTKIQARPKEEIQADPTRISPLARCKKVTVHAKKFVASLSQIPPIMPVLPTQPTRKYCAVYNLPEDSFHGMEEVIGSIPIRSTNYFNNLRVCRNSRGSI
jgi:hypothetical protein